MKMLREIKIILAIIDKHFRMFAATNSGHIWGLFPESDEEIIQWVETGKWPKKEVKLTIIQGGKNGKIR